MDVAQRGTLLESKQKVFLLNNYLSSPSPNAVATKEGKGSGLGHLRNRTLGVQPVGVNRFQAFGGCT